jgi:dTDP-4-amino-4,6-dideoxygalactose transaminase
MDALVETRIRNARQLDEGLKGLESLVRIPVRPNGYRAVHQLYQVSVSNRGDLMSYLSSKGIETKVHYPIPLHLQEAAAGLGYRQGDFPVCEGQADEIMTIPAHQHVSPEQIDHIVESFHAFASQ